MKEPDKYLNQLAHDVIGAAIEVHRTLGPGFLESVYEEAMCIELKIRNLAFEQQKTFAVNYKGYPVGESRLDILVENCPIVELKAVEALESIHKAQLISYLRSTGYLLGLLINFNVPVLINGVQRIVLS